MLKWFRKRTLQEAKDEFEAYDELVSRMDQISDRTVDKWIKLKVALKKIERERTLQEAKDEFEAYDELISRFYNISDRAVEKWVKLKVALKKIERKKTKQTLSVLRK